MADNTQPVGTSPINLKYPLDAKKAYAILDRVVNYGYDYIGVSLRGHNYVLKTLSADEESALQARTFGTPNKVFSIAWMMVYSTLYLDGIDMVADRDEEVLQVLYRHYCSLPASNVSALYETAVKLMRRVELASTMYQGYLFSDSSRTRWYTFKNSGGRWGVSAVHTSIGTSVVRELWSRGNHMLDAETEDTRAWDKTTFLASAHNPKGVKQTTNKMKTQRKMVEDEREDLVKYGSFDNRDVILSLVRGEEEKWTAPLRTRQDVIDELERQMTGVKDRHDLFVEKYDREMAELAAARKAEEAVRLAEVRRRRQEDRYRPFEGQREATDEELRRLGLVPNPTAGRPGVTRKSIRNR